MNIYDVAKKAGVSTTTVSRVINGGSRVSERTMKRVKDVMEELNYIPSQLAVGLATSTTKTIGIMVPDIRDSFHAEVAYLIENKMAGRGYTSILCNTTVEHKKENDYLNELHSKNVDAVILVGSSYHNKRIDETYKRWQVKIPLVLINSISGEGTVSVVCDETDGMVQALRHLKDRGRTNPVFIKDALDYQKRASITKEKAFQDGFRTVYGDREIPQSYTGRPEIGEYLTIIENLKRETADSILFTNDMCCAYFMKAMEKAGLSAPEDYALVGFNNARITDLTSPAITTIDHLAETHCEAAIEKLLALLEHQEVEKITYIKPELVVKQTT